MARGAPAIPGRRPTAVGCLQRLTRLSLPCGVQQARPGPGGRAMPGRRLPGTFPSPYSRCLSGGCHSAVTCPGSRQRSADQLITGGPAERKEGGARAEPATPPLCGVRRRRGPAHLQAPPAAGDVSAFPSQPAWLLSLRRVRGWKPCSAGLLLFIFLAIPQRGKRRALSAEGIKAR